MRKHKCTCGCTPAHSTATECAKNREATQAMMSRRGLDIRSVLMDAKSVAERLVK